MSLLSVVIPTYNRAEFVRDAIDSALAQRGVDHEVVVVDDCSQDETLQVLNSYGSRIRVVHHDENRGVAAARNSGARVASGKILAFLDSDDNWHPQKLVEQLPSASEGVPSVTGVSYLDVKGRRKVFVPDVRDARLVCLRNPFLGSGSTLVVPADAFWALGGFEESPRGMAEDWVMCIKLIRNWGQFGVVPRVLATVRVHEGNSFTRSASAVALARWSAIDWLEKSGIADTVETSQARALACTDIARVMANQGLWRDAGLWVNRSFEYQSRVQSLARLPLVVASAAKGTLRRTIRL